jgi:hypothetical protein
MAKRQIDNYEDLVERLPSMKKHVTPEEVTQMRRNNEFLREKYGKLWLKNLRGNCRHLFQKHGPITQDCLGLGRNKACIFIGAGASFNKNKDLLKELYALNMAVPFERQPFIFISCNHQFKPLLEMNIIPHFVMLLDGTTVVHDQLCKDIPKHGRGVTLLCPLRVHRNVVHEWDRQGRSIRFYISDNSWMIEEFEKVMGFDPHKLQIVVGHGGNVVNQMLLVSMHYLKSTVYMCVGNDLSYRHFDKLEDRRSNYYADGDYSSNLATGRDEARRELPWMGFAYEASALMPGEHVLRLEPHSTTHQLMLYKNWLENQVRIQATLTNVPFQYFNCTEGGILGVCSRKTLPELDKSNLTEAIKDKDNWYLLDEEIPKRYITSTLERACKHYLDARTEALHGGTSCLWEIPTDAKSAGHLPEQTATARSIEQSLG